MCMQQIFGVVREHRAIKSLYTGTLGHVCTILSPCYNFPKWDSSLSFGIDSKTKYTLQRREYVLVENYVSEIFS